MANCSFYRCIMEAESNGMCLHHQMYADAPLTTPIKVKEAEKVKKEVKKSLSVFYLEQIAKAPKLCEECGKGLRSSMCINPRAIICHILPKRTEMFPSVATNSDNVFFGCNDCHHAFDNKGEDFIVKMKIYPILLERVAKLLPFMPDKELNKIPEYLLK
jgi:hypothetical protein